MTRPVTLWRVPYDAHTPRRTVRVPDELWDEVRRKAADRGETITEVVIRALTRYVRDYDD